MSESKIPAGMVLVEVLSADTDSFQSNNTGKTYKKQAAWVHIPGVPHPKEVSLWANRKVYAVGRYLMNCAACLRVSPRGQLEIEPELTAFAG